MGIIENLGEGPIECFCIGIRNRGNQFVCLEPEVREVEQQKNELLERNIKFLNRIIGHGIDADSEFVEMMEKEIEEFKTITEKIAGKSYVEIKELKS